MKQGASFAAEWTAHSKALKSSITVQFNQFIILSVDETAAPATGCSIDKSVHFIKAMEKELEVSLLNKSQVAYMEEGEVKLVPLPKIKEKVNAGTIAAESIIFNNMVTDLKGLKNQWQVPAGTSWMSRYF